MSTWHEITGPVKRFAGASGTVSLPKGTKILHLAFQGGTCAGLPDGVGGNVTITSPSNGPFYYDPMHLECVCATALTLSFGGTTMYFVEAQNKDGFP